MCVLLYKVVIMLYLKVFLMHTCTRLKECKLEPHYSYVSFLEHGRIEFRCLPPNRELWLEESWEVSLKSECLQFPCLSYISIK